MTRAKWHWSTAEVAALLGNAVFVPLCRRTNHFVFMAAAQLSNCSLGFLTLHELRFLQDEPFCRLPSTGLSLHGDR